VVAVDGAVAGAVLRTLSGQPPQPWEIAVYGVLSIWLWLIVSFAVYPLSMPIPPWYSGAG
jgi:hypothetical protein